MPTIPSFLLRSFGRNVATGGGAAALAALAYQATGKRDKQSTADRVKEVGVSTAIGVAATAIAGPEATLLTQIGLGVPLGLAGSVLTNTESPTVDLLQSLGSNVGDLGGSVAHAIGGFFGGHDDPSSTHVRHLTSAQKKRQHEYRAQYYRETGR